MSKTKILVSGAAGRMGQSVIRLASVDKEIEITGCLEGKGHPSIGTGTPKITDDINEIIPNCDVVIDFTTPGASLEHLEDAVRNKKAVVIGATGFDTEGIRKVKEASKKIPILFTPNMSIGVNILFKLVEEVARLVPNYDCEILELHHNQKKDSPSGTATRLYGIICKALGRNPEKAGVYGRQGIIGARKKEEIGVMAIRAGDIVGDHTVYFAGPGERIELTHRAHSRDTFVQGAITAAKWLMDKEAGLYDMRDVLNLK